MILHILKYIKIVTLYLQLTTSQKSGSVLTKTYLCCNFLEYFIIERTWFVCTVFFASSGIMFGLEAVTAYNIPLQLHNSLTHYISVMIAVMQSFMYSCNCFHSTFGYFTCQIWKMIWWHLICHYVGIFGSLKMYTIKLNISDYFAK